MISARKVFNLDSDQWVNPDMKYLRIDLVSSDGTVTELSKLETGEVFIGREPGDGGVTVDNTAVSRQHGVFYRGKSHWFFKDLDSTNGSWLDGTQLPGGRWRLLHDGDILQLGDSVLKLHEERASGFAGQSSSGPALGTRSLVVFAHGNFLDEYPVPEYGRALVVGGSRGDLQLDGDLAELPTLVIERRGEKICAFGLSKDLTVSINDKPMTELVALKDSDELRLGQYSILFSDPSSATRNMSGAVPTSVPGAVQRETSEPTRGIEQTTKLSGVRDWGNGDSPREGAFPKTQTKTPFGQTEPDTPALDQTISIDPSTVRRGNTGYDRHPSMRYSEESEGSSYSLEALEDKVIIIIGGLLVLAVLVLLMWWFLG